MNLLYNGTPLPDIRSVYTPEVQKEWPYLVMAYNIGSSGNIDRYVLGGTKVPQTYNGEKHGHTGSYQNWYIYNYPDMYLPGTWDWDEEYGSDDESKVWASDTPILWSNHDILNTDGSVWFAGSKAINAETGEEVDFSPVPVTTINPSALMQGFFVGQALRRNRT